MGAEEEPSLEPRRVLVWREKEELGVGQGQEKKAGKSSGTNRGKMEKQGVSGFEKCTLLWSGGCWNSSSCRAASYDF